MDQPKTMPSVSYAIRGINSHGHFIVWEYSGVSAVNEYIAYDKGTYLVLYPKRRLIPSRVDLKKQSVELYRTRREF